MGNFSTDEKQEHTGLHANRRRDRCNLGKLALVYIAQGTCQGFEAWIEPLLDALDELHIVDTGVDPITLNRLKAYTSHIHPWRRKVFSRADAYRYGLSFVRAKWGLFLEPHQTLEHPSLLRAAVARANKDKLHSVLGAFTHPMGWVDTHPVIFELDKFRVYQSDITTMQFVDEFRPDCFREHKTKLGFKGSQALCLPDIEGIQRECTHNHYAMGFAALLMGQFNKAHAHFAMLEHVPSLESHENVAGWVQRGIVAFNSPVNLMHQAKGAMAAAPSRAEGYLLASIARSGLAANDATILFIAGDVRRGTALGRSWPHLHTLAKQVITNTRHNQPPKKRATAEKVLTHQLSLFGEFA